MQAGNYLFMANERASDYGCVCVSGVIWKMR